MINVFSEVCLLVEEHIRVRSYRSVYMHFLARAAPNFVHVVQLMFLLSCKQMCWQNKDERAHGFKKILFTNMFMYFFPPWPGVVLCCRSLSSGLSFTHWSWSWSLPSPAYRQCFQTVVTLSLHNIPSIRSCASPMNFGSFLLFFNWPLFSNMLLQL